MEHIANHSVATSIESSSGEVEWAWKSDPDAWHKSDFQSFALEVGLPSRVLAVDDVRVAVMYGEQSKIVTPALQAYMRSELGRHLSLVGIPDAGPHCFLAQPLAFVTALRVLLAEWGRSQTATGTGAYVPRTMARATHSDFDGDEAALREVLLREMGRAFPVVKAFTQPAASKL